MDPVRHVILLTCASLARLLLRMQDKLHSARYRPNGTVERYPHWSTTDLDPPSPWMDGMGSMALSGGIRHVTLTQAYLLTLAAQPGPIGGLEACLALQRMAATRVRWTKPTLKMAARLGVTLPASPSDAIFDFGVMREEELPPLPRI